MKWHRSLTSYAIGIASGSLLFGGLAYASSGVHLLSAHYANIGLTVNHQSIQTAAEPFIDQGNVYVPISAIAHGLGASVSWDGKNHQVLINDPRVATSQIGTVNYYGLPVYSGTHTVIYDGKSYVAGFALATTANLPYYIDPSKPAIYFGTVPVTGTPINAFYDVKDFGDYAKNIDGSVGPTYGWRDGAPKIAGSLYANNNSLVWSNNGSSSQVPGVMYNLNGHAKRLTGWFGLDDSSDGLEQVQMTITGDGQQLYQSPWQALGEQAATVSVDVTSTKLLTIAFSVKDVKTGTVYTVGQNVPNSLRVNLAFADVHVH
nr:hypothetical protein [Bacilli bacterium]